jgi:hypothetical protein
MMSNMVNVALVVIAGVGLASAAPRTLTVPDDFAGRWNLSLATPQGIQPSWLEVRKSGTNTYVGQFVGIVGSARPIGRILLSGDSIRFSIPPQWEQGPGDLELNGVLRNGRLSGTVTFPDGSRRQFTGVRAPALRRSSEPAWGQPLTLFNGRDISGWHVVGGENQWIVENGILKNTKSGGNLVTQRKFDDFKLHIEFRYPRGGNSGVYLRGRHEVQVQDDSGSTPESTRFGGIYGFLTPSEMAARGPGEWQSYDITLVGRMVTVVANGRTIISNQEIPGITGGALDSDEGMPGPLMLQGDHTAVEYRNIVLTPAKMAVSK